MAWRIVKQPNGLYARFSDVVDNFTHYDMSENEVINRGIDDWDVGKETITKKLQNAIDDPFRFEHELETVIFRHGKKEAVEIRELFTRESKKIN